jgi:putative hydrolase of the HAD superfamily
MMREYTHIIFDLGNTIIRFDHNISARKIVNLFHLDTKKVYQTFFDSHLTRDFETGIVSPREFYARTTRYLGINIPYKDFIDIWNDIFWADEDMCGLVRRLKGRYKLFLLSNVNRLHFDHIREKFDIISVFDEVILSFVVGAMKPDRAIFDDVVRRAGGNRPGLLYIDDREDLIKEAVSMGIDSIKFQGYDKLLEELAKREVRA